MSVEHTTEETETAVVYYYDELCQQMTQASTQIITEFVNTVVTGLDRSFVDDREHLHRTPDHATNLITKMTHAANAADPVIVEALLMKTVLGTLIQKNIHFHTELGDRIVILGENGNDDIYLAVNGTTGLKVVVQTSDGQEAYHLPFKLKEGFKKIRYVSEISYSLEPTDLDAMGEVLVTCCFHLLKRTKRMTSNNTFVYRSAFADLSMHMS